MTAAKHTPGPWKVARGTWGGEPCRHVTNAAGCPLASIQHCAEDADNALLMAAAPAMLQEILLAHRNILNALSVMTPEQKDEWARKNRADDCDGEGTTRNHERAAVIAKATGSDT